MKKLLSSLIILALIISSFSCVAFADGEKNWHLPMVDFSSADDIVYQKSTTATGFNSRIGWYANNETYYTYDADAQNVKTHPIQTQTINCGFGGNKLLVTENNEKCLVIKGQFCGNNKDAIRMVYYINNGGTYRTSTDVFTINGSQINGTAINNYYGDDWKDVIAVIDMPYGATSYTADVYANGQKIEVELNADAVKYMTSESNQLIGIDFKGFWGPRENARMDNTGVYSVERNNLPDLTVTQNNFKFTTTNEVTLANLSKDATLSLVKLNGQYLPLSAIKTEKGGLAFNVSEDALAYGSNTIDLSEVKDIFGQAPTGNATFTVEKPYPQVEVANSTVAAYEDGEGTYTNRFFKLIEEAEDYAKVVFEITADGFTWTVDLDEVYGNVTVNDTVYSKTGVYVATAAIGDVPSDDVEFSVNAYAVDFEGVSIPLN